jgi:hypothetical protein
MCFVITSTVSGSSGIDRRQPSILRHYPLCKQCVRAIPVNLSARNEPFIIFS